MDIIKFIRNNNSITYKGGYRLLDGTPTVNSISINSAGIFVNNSLTTLTSLTSLTTALQKLNYTPKVIKKYVDDRFWTSVNDNDVQHIVNTFNNEKKNINFTIEIETDNSLPFMDMGIIRTKN